VELGRKSKEIHYDPRLIDELSNIHFKRGLFHKTTTKEKTLS